MPIVPKKIGEYLKLPGAEQYTVFDDHQHSCRCWWRTIICKRHGGWRSSSVAESYVDYSTENKTQNSSKISNVINSKNLKNTLIFSNSNKSEKTDSNTTIKEPTLVFNNCSVKINNYYHTKI